MDNVNEEIGKRKRKKIKRSIIITIIVIIIASIATSIVLYINNIDFRNWIDKFILKKEITEEDAVIIDFRRRKKRFCIYIYK